VWSYTRTMNRRETVQLDIFLVRMFTVLLVLVAGSFVYFNRVLLTDVLLSHAPAFQVSVGNSTINAVHTL
jgi:hypothetical protein